ncbi:aspartate-semialdehyde dehydrogenase [Pseudomonas nicosulfuronedens]|uniref:Aspartate-semialdehyde dehydrogenase n=1 Tax=Pseudomonas nicosulfuronedens TaxID=2571105 RepID=A0A5R9QVU9_9PSED|nr:aspartate-semialdehyde dehydrogenase [Pseudomonas nicosulfuronedens]MDH1011586.1 aspartate-semialdehyde dehydrogenase [Pseudomonas nicosulfuronedens]MDH1980424.1 aspartate-semialdehyde dehydrogenase [Pseudomonas nicosulfuronedens]MDH2029356.1 aspartate-semialdehyde dehydrogenase [Pseudomonas nicosulfuronedens]TLX74257.1 aspartate-semialdehyde dehydrogenase [Pseudomonas nicosulfuronedens]
MLPPIPHSLAPVTAQQDVPKPRPDVTPVTPPAPSAGNAGVELERRPDEEALREEYQRRRKRRQLADGTPEGEALEELEEVEELGEDVQAAPRKGLWIDVEV